MTSVVLGSGAKSNSIPPATYLQRSTNLEQPLAVVPDRCSFPRWSRVLIKNLFQKWSRDDQKMTLGGLHGRGMVNTSGVGAPMIPRGQVIYHQQKCRAQQRVVPTISQLSWENFIWEYYKEEEESITKVIGVLYTQETLVVLWSGVKSNSVPLVMYLHRSTNAEQSLSMFPDRSSFPCWSRVLIKNLFQKWSRDDQKMTLGGLHGRGMVNTSGVGAPMIPRGQVIYHQQRCRAQQRVVPTISQWSWSGEFHLRVLRGGGGERPSIQNTSDFSAFFSKINKIVFQYMYASGGTVELVCKLKLILYHVSLYKIKILNMNYKL